MRIGFTFDLRSDYLKAGYTEEETAEFDSETTIEAIESALVRLGFEVDRIGHVRRLTERLVAGDRWDLVFNIAEGLRGRSREAQVPAILEAYDIPYVFSDPLTSAATLDKAVAKRLVRDAGIPTAGFAVLETDDDADTAGIAFPAFVRPLAEGTGKGCANASLVETRPALKAAARALRVKLSAEHATEPSRCTKKHCPLKKFGAVEELLSFNQERYYLSGGEKMVRFASIIHDLRHVAGRGGMGAVMGSKNLKAVAVKGTGKVEAAKPKKLQTLAMWMVKNVDRLAHTLHTYGTGAAMDVYEATGNLPVNNFREGVFPNVDSISAQTIKKTFSVGMETCFACAVRCKKIVKVSDGLWKVDPVYGGPEYETLAAFGSNCGIDDLKVVCKANELCQRYSLDTISTGVTISFAMECFEHNLLTLAQTDGIHLSFGNKKAMLKVIELIGQRKGIGDILAEGSKRASKILGSKTKRFSVQIKGQEVPMHDPRLRRGQGLGYAISPTGADHMHNIYDTLYSQKIPREIEGLGILEPVPIDDLGPKKIRLFHYVSTWNSLDNCLCLCMFTPWSVRQKVAIVNSVTGWKTTAFELIKVSERATNLARLFNIREGFDRKDDVLPSRLLDPKINGALSTSSINIKDLEQAKDIYYKMAGWNKKGIPTPEKLMELDIP